MKKILVSRCLYGGEAVRYDGKSKVLRDPMFLKWKAQGRLIPVCPEVMGGLPVPRLDAQRRGKKIITRDGQDVTSEYTIGAGEALRIAKVKNVVCAILKEKSPSCGSGLIYDGSFSGRIIQGQGLTTELLRRSGVMVFSEDELDIAAEFIKNEEARNV